MARIYTDAVVLKRIDFRETSVLLDLFTSELGRIRGLLKGARTPKSRIAPLSFTPGTRISTYLYARPHAGIGLLSSPAPTACFEPSASENLRAWHLMLHLVNTFTPERERSDEVFSLLTRMGPAAAVSRAPTVLYVAFKMKMIRILGYGVQLEKCVRCGAPDGPLFSGRLGGLLCPRCRGGDANAVRIARPLAAVMGSMDRMPVDRLPVIRRVPPAILAKVNAYANMILNYHTDTRVVWWRHENRLFDRDPS